MSESPVGQVANRSAPSLVLACLLLSVAAMAAGAVVGLFAYSQQGLAALQAAVVADVVCWLSATAALLLAGSLRGTPHAVSGILGGTLLRLLPPLATAVVCSAAAPAISQAGLFGYMVLFFLVMLVVETLLLVWLLGFGRGSLVSQPVAATSLQKAS